MRSRSLLIARLSIFAAAAFALLMVGLSQAKAVQEGPAAEAGTSRSEAGDGEPVIQGTERISIPYGFHAALPLLNGGASVEASGEGACTPAGGAISIAVTLTQSLSGAEATGLWNGTCTGERQRWTKVVTVTSGPNFSGGPAQACAFATVPDEESGTDTQDWCDDVLLAPYSVFLPIVQKP